MARPCFFPYGAYKKKTRCFNSKLQYFPQEKSHMNYIQWKPVNPHMTLHLKLA
jgi:hypothetical protein